jgi:hypothetical protein
MTKILRYWGPSDDDWTECYGVSTVECLVHQQLLYDMKSFLSSHLGLYVKLQPNKISCWKPVLLYLYNPKEAPKLMVSCTVTLLLTVQEEFIHLLAVGWQLMLGVSIPERKLVRCLA